MGKKRGRPRSLRAIVPVVLLAVLALGASACSSAEGTGVEVAIDRNPITELIKPKLVSAIKDGQVGEGKIATDAVTSAKIKDGAVATGKLAGSAVTSDKIAGSAVTTDKINNGAVTGAKIGAGQVATDKLNTALHMIF